MKTATAHILCSPLSSSAPTNGYRPCHDFGSNLDEKGNPREKLQCLFGGRTQSGFYLGYSKKLHIEP